MSPPINGMRPKPLSRTVLATEPAETPPPPVFEADTGSVPGACGAGPLSKDQGAGEAAETSPAPLVCVAASARAAKSPGAAKAVIESSVPLPAASVKLSSNFSCVVLPIFDFRRELALQNGERFYLASGQIREARASQPPPDEELLHQCQAVPRYV